MEGYYENDCNYADQTEYIEKLMGVDDYSKFCEKIDASTMNALGERYSIYTDNYDTYLRRHLVISLYKTERTRAARMLAIDSIYDGMEEFYVYVNLLASDEGLQDYQKEREIKVLCENYSVVGKIETKIEELEEPLNMSDSAYNSIIILKQMVKFSEIQMIVAKFTNNKTLEDTAKENIVEWNNLIDQLILQLN